ncbi:MAG: heparinase II/III family protein [Spirochaetes bacterium]|nr:heparinase II/III family protein [Spirochaetota bacterium]
MRRALLGLLLLSAPALLAGEDDPLFDWTPWEKYRKTVALPAAILSREDVARARSNIVLAPWAARYRDVAEASAQGDMERLTPAVLAAMIPEETPGDPMYTPCPACRDQKKPYVPHGKWTWNDRDPERLVCQFCATSFPNDAYPESLVFELKYGRGKISYYGGAPFNIFFGFMGRPSFTANIRSRKASAMAGRAWRTGEAWALTGKPEYAKVTRAILMRFADVYPRWLIHDGYGNYVDQDPRAVVRTMDRLTVDEITGGSAAPARKLTPGWNPFWASGRASATGMESGFVRNVLGGYELTRDAMEDGKPIYSEADRLHIERNLLLESTLLMVADKAVNNKSVGNATMVSLVGIALGHPLLTRFGLDNFLKTVDGWFLPDGATPESWSYGMMAIQGIQGLGQAFRGYSDPPGFRDGQGKRLDHFDLYHDTAYKKVWEAFFLGLRGDLVFPSLSDSYTNQRLGNFVELMAYNYPENAQYLALLKESLGPDLTNGGLFALYGRPPGLEKKPSPPLRFPDHLYPSLKLGQLRGGEDGRESLLILDATEYGNHHQMESLNLYYWRRGQELLSDLGYLWDLPAEVKYMAERTFAHQTVMVDGVDQRTKGRGGDFSLFATNRSDVKVMVASSKAYAQADVYERTVAKIVPAPGKEYVLDFFRVRGGKKHEYVLHGMNNRFTLESPARTPVPAGEEVVRFCVRLHLSEPECEITADRVSILEEGGRELFGNPSGQKLDEATGKPSGWGVYAGDGGLEWEAAPEAGVTLRSKKAGATGMNVALLLGESDGYRGTRALEAVRGKTYRVSFRVKGDAKIVKPAVLYWNGDASQQTARAYTPIKGLSAISATGDWKTYAGEFTLSGGARLAAAARSREIGAWKIVWDASPELRFAAHWWNESGEETLTGDGWGQRNMNNLDAGAVLPYFVRGLSPKGMTRFTAAFEAFPPGAAHVLGVRALPVPESETENAVVLAVATIGGTDYAVSLRQARPVILSTPDGKIGMDGRFAWIPVRGGEARRGALIEGRSLTWNGKELPKD